MAKKLVLVTGASGFVGSHVVKTLLEGGYRVRGTVRSLRNQSKIQPLKELCPEADKNLELVEADLMEEGTWPSAIEGCDYVLHVASPFAFSVKDEAALIKPAVEGTLNVLKAAAGTKGAIKRIVLTSSLASVIFTPDLSQQDRVYTEDDWSSLDSPGVDAYVKSKVLAEKAAWDFVAGLKGKEKFELTTICPGLILGPTLINNTEGESVQFMKQMLTGKIPFVPHLPMAISDVRDVAKAHMVAMTTPQMVNQRLILADDTYWYKELAQTLSNQFSSKGYWIGTREAPYALLWLLSWFNGPLATILPRIGLGYKVDNSKMKKELGMEPIPMQKSMLDMANSLIDRGIVPRKF